MILLVTYLSIMVMQGTYLAQSVSSISQDKKKCSVSESCLKIINCPTVNEMYLNFKSSKKGDPGRAEIGKKLKNLVCNKEEQAVCCEKEMSTDALRNVSSGNFLPVASDRTCGLEDSETSQFIIGGDKTRPGQFPFMALLGSKTRKIARGRTSIVPQWVCGGSLINHWYVLTAAHCQNPQRPLAYVRLGDWDVTTKDCTQDGCLPPPQNFDIEKHNFIPHIDYSPNTDTQKNVLNDIALIRLPRQAKRNPGVQFVCLPLTMVETDIADEQQEGVIIGWGHTSAFEAIFDGGEDLVKHRIPEVIQQSGTIPVVDKEQCDASWKLSNGVQKGQLCAGGQKVDSCRGDSGGPFVVRAEGSTLVSNNPWILTGIVSFGPAYCGSGRPGVYTRVGYYVDWIRGQLEE